MKIQFPGMAIVEEWGHEHYKWANSREPYPYSRAYHSADPIDHFWLMLGTDITFSSQIQELRQTFCKKFMWMLENNIHFLVNFEVTDSVVHGTKASFDTYGDFFFRQTIEYWLEIEDPEHALLFKLRWA